MYAIQHTTAMSIPSTLAWWEICLMDEYISDLVDDIGNYPDNYYMNFHSIASWSYWQSHGGGVMIHDTFRRYTHLNIEKVVRHKLFYFYFIRALIRPAVEQVIRRISNTA